MKNIPFTSGFEMMNVSRYSNLQTTPETDYGHRPMFRTFINIFFFNDLIREACECYVIL